LAVLFAFNGSPDTVMKDNLKSMQANDIPLIKLWIYVI